jgi:hypothetical protein
MYERARGAAYSVFATTGCGTSAADGHGKSAVRGATFVPVRARTASVLSRQGPAARERLRGHIAAKSGELEQH